MRRVLITGLSGVGKSTVLARLAALGHRVIETDDDGWLRDVQVEGPEGRTTTEPLLVTERLDDALADEKGELLVVVATARNQGELYDRFDAIVLLTAPVEVMAHRLMTRTTNPYGKDPAERAAALAYKETVEPLLRRGTTLEIDTGRTGVEDVVAQILRHIGLATP